MIVIINIIIKILLNNSYNNKSILLNLFNIIHIIEWKPNFLTH